MVEKSEFDDLFSPFPKGSKVDVTTVDGVQYAENIDKYGIKRKYEIVYFDGEMVWKDGEYESENFEDVFVAANYEKSDGSMDSPTGKYVRFISKK